VLTARPGGPVGVAPPPTAADGGRNAQRLATSATADPVALPAGDDDLTRRLAAVERIAGAPLADAWPPLLRATCAPEPVLRRAALDALLDALADGADGLEAYVARAGIDRRCEILLLRTVRDMRDVRAASYLFAVAASDDRRARNDALGAMHVTRAQTIARSHLWAGPEEPRLWPGLAGLRSAVRATLADRGAPSAARAFAALLAGHLTEVAVIPELRAEIAAWLAAGSRRDPEADASTVAAATLSLARLSPADVAPAVAGLLASTSVDLREVVPTVALALARGGDDGVASEVRRRLDEAMRTPDDAQADAVWIGAALGSAVPLTGLTAALTSPRADARRAAAWALGERDGDPAMLRALAVAARDDQDDLVRRLAAGAAAKQRGDAPRALGFSTDVGRDTQDR
jgi:hypothetical protein